MIDTWRLFLAVPLGDRLRTDLGQAVATWRLRDDLSGLRWTAAEGWHVTLAFLGSVPAIDVPRITGAVAKAAGIRAAMTLTTGRLGAFPSPARASVAWYGVADVNGSLAALATNLRGALGLDSSGPFRAHVTLARARGKAVDVRPWLAGASAPEGELVVDRVDLMRSHIGRGPARYETLGSIPLGMPADA